MNSRERGNRLRRTVALVITGAAVIAAAAPLVVAPGPGRARLAKVVVTLLVVLTALPVIALLTA
ncbi:hypothetical protein [Nocardia lasii]|uniref:Uncharacterized protein n=1 Tax=Nocardia lasii TaxID=1616107 RepID=A0ABW1JY57_9NOCA